MPMEQWVVELSFLLFNNLLEGPSVWQGLERDEVFKASANPPALTAFVSVCSYQTVQYHTEYSFYDNSLLCCPLRHKSVIPTTSLFIRDPLPLHTCHRSELYVSYPPQLYVPTSDTNPRTASHHALLHL